VFISLPLWRVHGRSQHAEDKLLISKLGEYLLEEGRRIRLRFISPLRP